MISSLNFTVPIMDSIYKPLWKNIVKAIFKKGA